MLLQYQNTLLFAHCIKNYKRFKFIDPFFDDFNKNIKELSADNWKLHKKYLYEGVNPNEITKIIRNDDLDSLQEITAQNEFDFNQLIKPSLYEKCSFINQDNVSLIDYAAFFGSIKCFKYFFLNGSNLKNSGPYSIAGGNLEIIHYCEQYHSSFERSYEIAIKFHQNKVFHYLFENKIGKLKSLIDLGIKCIKNNNFEILYYLEENGMIINDLIIYEAAKSGNIFLVKYFLERNQIPKYILSASIKSGNIELIKYFLDQKGIDINAPDIYMIFFDMYY